MSRRFMQIFVAITVIGTFAAIAWATIWLWLGDLALYDTNLDAFKTLDAQHGEGIAQTAQAILRSAVLPLVGTNCLWLLVLVVRQLATRETKANKSA